LESVGFPDCDDLSRRDMAESEVPVISESESLVGTRTDTVSWNLILSEVCLPEPDLRDDFRWDAWGDALAKVLEGGISIEERGVKE
jgi:hypothetical protein